MTTANVSQDNHSSLEKLIAEAEALIKRHTESPAEAIGENAESQLRDLVQRLKSGAASVSAFTQEKAKVADHFVHERPYLTAGVAAALGLAVGALLTRQCCQSR